MDFTKFQRDVLTISAAAAKADMNFNHKSIIHFRWRWLTLPIAERAPTKCYVTTLLQNLNLLEHFVQPPIRIIRIVIELPLEKCSFSKSVFPHFDGDAGQPLAVEVPVVWIAFDLAKRLVLSQLLN
jgi:hypothetical protein